MIAAGVIVWPLNDKEAVLAYCFWMPAMMAVTRFTMDALLCVELMMVISPGGRNCPPMYLGGARCAFGQAVLTIFSSPTVRAESATRNRKPSRELAMSYLFG